MAISDGLIYPLKARYGNGLHYATKRGLAVELSVTSILIGAGIYSIFNQRTRQ
jgi:hypothetical protein